MGISDEFKKLKGKKIDLSNAFDFARYKSNTFETSQKIKQNYVTDNGSNNTSVGGGNSAISSLYIDLSQMDSKMSTLT